jgi:hypothetical protein
MAKMLRLMEAAVPRILRVMPLLSSLLRLHLPCGAVLKDYVQLLLGSRRQVIDIWLRYLVEVTGSVCQLRDLVARFHISGIPVDLGELCHLLMLLLLSMRGRRRRLCVSQS